MTLFTKTGPHVVLRRKVSWSEVERALKCPRLRLFLLQVCRTALLCLRGVGPPHTVQHAVSSPARRDDRKFLHNGGEELSRGNMRTRIFIHTWHLNGARQAKHLECQPEAVEPWKRLVENWLQLRVVKTTTREREKKESPTQWMKPTRHNIESFGYWPKNCRHIKACKEQGGGGPKETSAGTWKISSQNGEGRDRKLKNLNVQVSKKLGQEKKQKLKKNNRARKNERARLRNSDDPAASQQ